MFVSVRLCICVCVCVCVLLTAGECAKASTRACVCLCVSACVRACVCFAYIFPDNIRNCLCVFSLSALVTVSVFDLCLCASA